MTARIYKPSKTAMQSGRGKTEKWVLEFFQNSATKSEPQMAWRTGSESQKQVKKKYKLSEYAYYELYNLRIKFCKQK